MKSKIFAIGITTFLRDESLYVLIESILKNCPNIKIYIAEQGEVSQFKNLLYRGLEKTGHKIFKLPKDCGISYARKYLLEHCKEPYLVFMQDDFIASEKTNLNIMSELMINHPEIDIVAGNVSNSTNADGKYPLYKMVFLDNKIIYIPISYLINIGAVTWQKEDEIEYIKTDIMPDFTMWKKSNFNIFDINVKTVEHSHTYLRAQEQKLNVIYTPNVSIKHSHQRNNPEYMAFRNRRVDVSYVEKYWNVTKFVKIDETAMNNFTKNNTLDSWDSCLDNPIIIEEVTPITPISIEKVKEEIMINMPDDKAHESEILSFLEVASKRISICLLKDTCYYAIKYKKVSISDTLFLGVSTDAMAKELQSLQKDKYPHLKLYINTNQSRKTKPTIIQNIHLNVPMPLVKYLETLYQKSWKELINE